MEGGAGFLKRISHQMSIFRNFFSQIFAKQVDVCVHHDAFPEEKKSCGVLIDCRRSFDVMKIIPGNHCVNSDILNSRKQKYDWSLRLFSSVW
jgi:hypothetical protein